MALEPITRQEQIIAGKDLEPVTRMEKFLKEYGGASSWNDLTDKPFGEEGFECRDIQLVSSEGSIETDFTFIPGQNYTIIWNGTEYNCTAYALEQFNGVGAVGNSAIIGGENNGMPFLLVAMNALLVNLLEADAVVTIIGKKVVRLQEKFMPKTVPLMEDGKVPASKVESDVFYVYFNKGSDGTYTCPMTKKEIVNANNAGKLVVGRVQTSGGYYNLLLHGADSLFLSFSGYVCDYLGDANTGKNMLVQYDGTTVTVKTS